MLYMISYRLGHCDLTAARATRSLEYENYVQVLFSKQCGTDTFLSSAIQNGRSIVKFEEKYVEEKYGTLHDFACHPCAGAMLIFSVSFQF